MPSSILRSPLSLVAMVLFTLPVRAEVETRRCAQLGPVAYSRRAVRANFEKELSLFHNLATAGVGGSRNDARIDLFDANNSRLVEVIAPAHAVARLVLPRAPLGEASVSVQGHGSSVDALYFSLHRGAGDAKFVVSLFNPKPDGTCGRVW